MIAKAQTVAPIAANTDNKKHVENLEFHHHSMGGGAGSHAMVVGGGADDCPGC